MKGYEAVMKDERGREVETSEVKFYTLTVWERTFDAYSPAGHIATFVVAGRDLEQAATNLAEMMGWRLSHVRYYRFASKQEIERAKELPLVAEGFAALRLR